MISFGSHGKAAARPRQLKVVTGIRAAGLGCNHSRRMVVAAGVLKARQLRRALEGVLRMFADPVRRRLSRAA